LKQCKQEKFQLLIQNGLAYQVGQSEVLPPGLLKFSMIRTSLKVIFWDQNYLKNNEFENRKKGLKITLNKKIVR
jgi:hypothetical protein